MARASRSKLLFTAAGLQRDQEHRREATIFEQERMIPRRFCRGPRKLFIFVSQVDAGHRWREDWAKKTPTLSTRECRTQGVRRHSGCWGSLTAHRSQDFSHNGKARLVCADAVASPRGCDGTSTNWHWGAVGVLARLVPLAQSGPASEAARPWPSALYSQ